MPTLKGIVHPKKESVLPNLFDLLFLYRCRCPSETSDVSISGNRKKCHTVLSKFTTAYIFI